MANRKRLPLLLFSLLVLIIPAILIVPANAATTATVTATVTVQSISVSVSPGTVSYGTLAAGASKSTIASEANATQTATNNGNQAESFNISGANGANWTLAGTPGSETYVHKFCISSCATPPTNYTALTTGYATLATNVAQSGTQTFDLQITTPSSTAQTSQQSLTVTVQAVAYP